MAQSTATNVIINNDTHTVTVEVMHSDYASYRRSVMPCANKAFDKFMRSPQGQAWISAGYYRFSTNADFGAIEGGSIVTYSITEG
jgi:hypothetical protein